MSAAPVAAVPENRTIDAAITSYANYETVSVYGTYVGDDNNNGTARFDYKETSSSSWLAGMPMHKIIDEKRFAAFFFAQPNTSYDVRVTFTDPDGVVGPNPVSTTVTTRSDQIPPGSGKQYYVSPKGSDSNPGTAALPFKTLSKAASLVVPGDTVYVKAGTYRERVNLIGKSGTSSNWITFQAFGDGPAILDGSDPALLSTGQNRWTLHSVSVYKTPLSYIPQPYVAIAGLRAYHYPSLASLMTGFPSIPAGWFYSNGILYLRTKDGSDPDLHVIQVAKQQHGFELGNSHYLRIKGFTVQYYGGAAIRLQGGESDILIEENTLHNNSFGIQKRGQGGSAYTIQRNRVSDTEVSTWPWNKVKHTDHEGAGIALSAIDRGAVMRDNVVSGHFNGVQISLWPPALGYNFDSDVYRNTIADCGDDGAELEGSNQTNIRFWENTMTKCFTGISLAPVLRGPVYLFRNTGYQIIQQGFKVGSAGFDITGLESVGAVYAYHNTIHAIDDVGNGDDAVQCTNTPSYQNHAYRNNVFYSGRYVVVHGDCTSVGTSYDYDLMYTKDTSRFVQWDKRTWYPTLSQFQTGTGQALHAINVIPQFENLATGDLRLTATGPGIDVGVVLVGFNDANSPWPSTGSRPDLGAFEIGEPAPINPPPVNQSPVLAPIGNKTVRVGDLLTFSMSASDPDGDVLIYSVSRLPAGAAFTGLTFTWTPSIGQVGTYPVTVTVSDGQLSDSETITITVQTNNQPPVLATIGNKSAKVGDPLIFFVTATDPENDPLTYAATNLPLRATFTSQTFSWTPSLDQVGIYQVTFTVSDGALADAETITITVFNVNQVSPAEQTPWQTNAYGVLETGLNKDEAIGYHFTPQVAGQITQLGGFFKGTKTVKLFHKATGALLATASVTAANTWSYAPISPITVSAGTTYTVAVYLAGSGGTKRRELRPPMPQLFGDVRIEGSTYTSTGIDPNARPINTETKKMMGQADVVFVPSGPAP